MNMKEKLEARLKELVELADKYSADLNYILGAKDEVIKLLNSLKEENAD